MLGTGLCSRVRLGKVVISLGALLLVAGGLCGHVHADEDSQPAPLEDSKPALLAESSWEIGLEYDYLAYEERELGAKLMEVDGSLFGVGVAWTGHQPSGLMVRVAGRLVGGGLEYDGQTWAGDPVKADTNDFIFRLRGLVGYDYQRPDFALTPYIGIAYRYWNDDIGGAGGYGREVQYWYTPIGIETVAPLGDEWTWGVRGEYDLFWGGTVKSHLSDFDSGYNDPTVDQDDGYGARGSVYFERALGDVSLALELFVRYWDIDVSDTDSLTWRGMLEGIVYEPKNETTVTGFLVSVLF